MFSAQFTGIKHWSFTDLYNRNQDIYRILYQEAHRSIKEKIYTDPSTEDLETAIFAMLLEEGNFRHHCASKQSFNPEFSQDCAKKLAEYIVFNLYRR